MVRFGLGAQESQMQRRLDRRGLSLEVVIVLLCGILGAAGRAYVALEIWNKIESPLPYLNFTLIGYIIRPIVFVLGVWLVYILTTHLLANSFGGRGPISRLARTSAWAVIPFGVWLLLRSLVLIVLFLNVTIPPSPEGISPDAQLQTILELGLGGSAYFLTFVLGLAFVAWSWRLLTVAVGDAKDIEEANARKLAAIPAVLTALWLLYAGLQWIPF